MKAFINRESVGVGADQKHDPATSPEVQTHSLYRWDGFSRLTPFTICRSYRIRLSLKSSAACTNQSSCFCQQFPSALSQLYCYCRNQTTAKSRADTGPARRNKWLTNNSLLIHNKLTRLNTPFETGLKKQKIHLLPGCIMTFTYCVFYSWTSPPLSLWTHPPCWEPDIKWFL